MSITYMSVDTVLGCNYNRCGQGPPHPLALHSKLRSLVHGAVPSMKYLKETLWQCFRVEYTCNLRVSSGAILMKLPFLPVTVVPTTGPASKAAADVEHISSSTRIGPPSALAEHRAQSPAESPGSRQVYPVTRCSPPFPTVPWSKADGC